ncbi:signal peptidase 22 kDa subunit [Meredithblackwellia eburnea MCA 4105]
MYSLAQRANNVSASVTSALMALLALIAFTSFLIPTNIDPASLKVSNLNVVLGRSNHERYPKAREFAFAQFDLVADLTPLFHWNTKQVIVYLVADYSTPKHASNSVVVWDRIIRSSKYAKINIARGKQKYEFKEITDSFKNVSATFSLQYNIQPHVGALQWGEVVRTEALKLPAVAKRGVAR